MQEVEIHNSIFESYITENEIDSSIGKVAEAINVEYQDQHVMFIAVLNGSFMFCADLLKKITISCTVSFVKMQSYEGQQTTGKVNELIGLTEDLKGVDVVIVEDIVDTGNTLVKLHELLNHKSVNSIKTATLLYKPEAYKKNLPIDFVGIEIPNEFVLGYGLDYDGLGRNLSKIYKLKKQ